MLRRRDGQEFTAHMTGAPLFDARGTVVDVIGVMQDITERKRDEERTRFVSQAGVMLSSSLDYEATLQQVAELATREVADWCLVSMQDEGGALRHLALAQLDPHKREIARRMLHHFPPDRSPSGILREAMDSGRSVLIAEMTSEVLARAQSNEQRQLLHQLDISGGSLVAVPLNVRERTIGVLTLV